MAKKYKQTIIIYYCMIFYFQIVYAYYKRKPVLSKDEVLKNGNETSYIIETCTYDNAILGNCRNFNDTLEGKHYSTICTKNSECLSDRCVNGFCVFNDLNPVTCCVTVYTHKFLKAKPESHMHCGKALDEPCRSSDECSSKLCGEDGLYSDGAIILPILVMSILFGTIGIFIWISCCIICWCHQKRIKTNTLLNN
ncbi:hypothetical protein H8356DRAFT_1285538 [Neocallimastix lanati (nom. inval.)]|nr:hypothetical protein H8356DRAFT_1285538 [Neocallimastix sp. JGI-2020a]